MHAAPASLLAVVALTLAVSAHAEEKRCPTASRFGPDDEVGNLNYVTPEKTLATAKLVTRGKSYRLGIETNRDTPSYPPRSFASAPKSSRRAPRSIAPRSRVR